MSERNDMNTFNGMTYISESEVPTSSNPDMYYGGYQNTSNSPYQNMGPTPNQAQGPAPNQTQGPTANQGPYHGQGPTANQGPYHGQGPAVNQGPYKPQGTAAKQRNKVKKKKSGKTSFAKKLGMTAAVAAVFGLVAGGVFQGIDYGVDKLRGNKEDTTIVSDNSGDESDASVSDPVKTQQVGKSAGTATVSYDVADVVAKTQPSIVSITTKVTQTYQYFFQSYEQEASGAGSGIIIGQDDDKLYIATNYHVIEDAKEIKVGFNDGEIVDAEVKGSSKNDDIAVVAVDKTAMKDSTKDAISVATVGDSSKLQVGEPAIAIGNALGYGQSVTVGYISALDRPIQDAQGTFIQTDAAINPGNSGGALIDAEGKVIGINSIKYADTQVEGMGFSIPINHAMTIINSIIEGKSSGNVTLGINGAEISSEYSQIYGFPMGVYVKEAFPGGSAYDAGIHAGDIIVEFDGQEVYTIDDLHELLSQHSEGDTVNVKLSRSDLTGNYEEETVSVTLKAGD